MGVIIDLCLIKEEEEEEEEEEAVVDASTQNYTSFPLVLELILEWNFIIIINR
jgi:hypothetical protein